jgi:hypothetical protein
MSFDASAHGDADPPPDVLALTRARVAHLDELMIAPGLSWFDRLAVWLERRRLERRARRIWAKASRRLPHFTEEQP